MSKSFYILQSSTNYGHYDDGTYRVTDCGEGPNIICYCETYDDAKEILVKYARSLQKDDWYDLTYVKIEDDAITKRFGFYDKKLRRYFDGYQVTLWFTKREFTKP